MRKPTIILIGILMLILASAPALLAQDGIQDLLEDNDVYLPIVRNDPSGTVPTQ